MGRYAPIILLVAAVAVALITSVVTYNYLQEKKEVGVVKSVETVPVAVAALDLYGGSVINRERVKLRTFMAGSLQEGTFFSDLEALEGRVVLSPVKAGEPVLLSRLAPESLAHGGVPAVIKENKRAISLRVDQVIGVAGFIKPGDKVDILVTLSNPDGGETITKIVLENMLVLATGAQVAKSAEGAAAPVGVITIEVTPEEAEKVALATTMGRIQLALRSYKDSKEVYTRGATVPALLASYKLGGPAKAPAQSFAPSAPRAAAPQRAAAPSHSYSVWTFNGNASQQTKIK
jgi:pilus assembly protein CpaB